MNHGQILSKNDRTINSKNIFAKSLASDMLSQYARSGVDRARSDFDWSKGISLNPSREKAGKMRKQVFIVCALAGTVSASGAGVTQIGQFTGDANERFENIAPPGTVPGPVDLFGGAGSANDPFAGIMMMAINLTSFLTNETIFAYNGNLMGGSVTGIMDFSFEQGVTEFGGYFGTVDILNGGSISFYDEHDALIETQAFDMPLNDWDWYGWSSTEAFSRVSIWGSANPGTPIVFDDLQVNFVPTPASGMLVMLGGACVMRRRRV